MKRVVYIIPGYNESHATHKSYGRVAKLFEAKGIQPIHVDIDWASEKPRRFSTFVRQFLAQYKKERGTKTYILGFSYGATTAFLSAAKTKPSAFIFCSLSPYFIEDQKNLKLEWLGWFRKNFIESDYSFRDTFSNVSSPAHFIVGTKESPSIITRARSARRRIPRSTLTLAKGAKHDIGQKEYLVAVERVIRKL